MTVDPNANLKKGGGKDLTVVRGETLDVIQFTNEKKALCRNPQGKCKFKHCPLLHSHHTLHSSLIAISITALLLV